MVVVLLAVYVATLAAILHPHVSSAYRAYFIDRTTKDYDPTHYDSTPEQGMTFQHIGLPQWVDTVYGFGAREDGGRWTDSNLGTTAGLNFNRSFAGELCLDFTAHAVAWMAGQSIRFRMDHQEQSLRIETEAPTDYRLQFTDLQGAHQLQFMLPKMPTVVERRHGAEDPRRLGINISTLRLIPGKCSAGQEDAPRR